MLLTSPVGNQPFDERVAALALEVVGDDPRSAHQQLARGLAVVRQLLAVFADDLHVDAEHRAPLLGLHRHALVGAESLVLGLQRAHRAERAHLGHAPGVQHLHVVALLEGAHHRRRARRAADDRAAHRAELEVVGFHVGQQALPHRGHAGRHGDAFALEQLVQALAVEVRPRKHELGADHARGIRQAPGVDVEHRHHRQDRVACRAVQRSRAVPLRRCAAASSGGCTARPWGCRWCPTCSTASWRCSRRSSAR